MDFRQHTVLITGATSGIGTALAHTFHSAGARVIAAGRNQTRQDALATSLPTLEPVQVDLSRPTERQEFAAEVRRRFPDLSILVNNAGVQHPANYVPAIPDEETPNAGIRMTGDQTRFFSGAREEIESDCTAVVDLTLLFFPLLLAAPSAAVVFISSGLAIAPRKGAPVYCASKSFIRTFARALRYQCTDEAPHVHILDVCPPLVDTPMTAGRGRNKISPEKVARATLSGLRQKKAGVAVGKARALRFLHRFFPAVAYRILRNS